MPLSCLLILFKLQLVVRSIRFAMLSYETTSGYVVEIFLYKLPERQLKS